MDKIYMTWEQFDFAVEHIYDKLLARGKLRDISSVYGIPRGGLPLAVALSHKLQKPLISSEEFMRGGRILLVDDISDSGNTLARLAPIATVTATIHLVRSSKFEPDIWVYTKPENTWMVYPWENKIWPGS